MALRTVEVAHRDDYNYGVGADLASGSPMGFVVEGEPVGIPGAGGASVTLEVRRITSTEELEQTLGVDAEASYGSGLFGAGISARVGYARTCKVQTTSLFMLVTAKITLERLSIKVPKLTVAAANLAGNVDAFAERYGNMFVRGVDRGGLFVGIFRFDVHSEQERTAVSTELEGSYGLFSADVAVKFDSIRTKYRCDALVSMYHEGGPKNLKINDFRQPHELMDNANLWLDSFTTAPEDNAVPYTVTLAPISIAEGPLPPNSAQIQKAQDVLVMCGKQRSRILDKLNLLEYVIDHPDAYDWSATPNVTLATLTAAANGFQKDLDLVGDCASDAINSPTTARTPATYAEEEGKTYPAGVMPDQMPPAKPPKPTEATIRIQSLIGVDIGSFEGAQRWLSPGHAETIDQIMAGLDVYEDGHPIFPLSGVTREQAQFIELVSARRLELTVNPTGIDANWQDAHLNYVLTEQFPPAETMAVEGSMLTVTFTPVST